MGTQDREMEYLIQKALEEQEYIEEYKKIIRVALGKWLNNLKSGEIKLNSISDLKVLIEADLMLKQIEK
ncbi:hypothetical protein MXF21_11460 [Enterococcus casseliflavus]|uniref:hypothetical protein n=1 Tax=Enterococcus casseliflavus TaxID=37734 RepID=UPI002DBC4015|nr:hypothetical protein [Enterococcus casseliflavus]MEB6086731.1 hypothetical protein [Enterococcus casseliflavus]